ncbi:MAG: glycerate dehydrogenase [Paraglaciecola sp.]|jgi:glycerate dehydrogenase
MPNIVVLDAHTTNPGDLDWQPIEALGLVKIYDRTPADKLLERCQNAEIILTNKAVFNEDIFAQLPQLKLIATLSTGYNVIDVKAAKKHDVTVCNVSGYSTSAVAQQVFSYILNFTNQVQKHDTSVQSGQWENHVDWCYFLNPIQELKGKTLGIFGLGKIGQKVAEIALVFEMKVIAYRQNVSKGSPLNVELVDIDTLVKNSDFLTLHAPLTAESEGFINQNILSEMKKTAFLINTGRGGLIVENDLKIALENGIITGAALDVLSAEPPHEGNILIGTKNCLITPHNAWMSQQSRRRLIAESGDNIRAFLDNKPRNVVS